MKSMAILRFKSIALCFCFYAFSVGFAMSAENEEPLDVRILIDISGSMKQNDPNNLRQPALELLIDLLPDDSKVGVWSFGKFVNMLVKHDNVDQNWRDNAKRQIDSINNLGQRTNLAQALVTSAYDFDFKNFKPGTHFILLTDGMVDVSRDSAVNLVERDKILEKILPNFKEKQAIIHTIALSDQADFSLLQQMSIQTKGVADTAYEASDLTPIFLKAFDRLVSSEQVSLVNNEFKIDKSIEEFTALIFHKEGESILLRSPNGQLIDSKTPRNDVKWKTLDTYDLITIEQPKFGTWKIEGNVDALSRVSVISNISLNISLVPSNLFSQQIPDFATWLTGEYVVGDTNAEDSSDRIMDESLLSLVNVNVDIIQNGESVLNKNLVKKLDEFIFEGEHFLKQGEYELKINLTSPTFERQLLKNIVLRSAFSVESLGVSKPEEFYLIRVYQNDSSIDSKSVKIQAKVNDAVVNFSRTDHGYWEYKQFEIAGQSLLKLEVLANYSRGVQSIDEEKIASMELLFPINDKTQVKLNQNIEKMMPQMEEKIPDAPPTKIATPGDPDVVIGFNKLSMPKVEALDKSVEKPVEVEQMQSPIVEEIMEVEDQWGEEEMIPEINDDSLNVTSILLATIPLVLLVGGGIFFFNRFSNNKLEIDDEDDGYTEEEKQALAALDGEIEESPEEIINDEFAIDVDDDPLEKEIPIQSGGLEEPEISAQEIETVQNEIADSQLDTLTSDLEEDISEPLDTTFESIDSPTDDLDIATDDLDIATDEVESDPVEDALEEFDKQVTADDEFEQLSADELESQNDINTDQSDPFEDIADLDEVLNDTDSNAQNSNDGEFNIDVDPLDSGGFDDMDLDKDDNPFEEGEEKS